MIIIRIIQTSLTMEYVVKKNITFIHDNKCLGVTFENIDISQIYHSKLRNTLHPKRVDDLIEYRHNINMLNKLNMN